MDAIIFMLVGLKDLSSQLDSISKNLQNEAVKQCALKVEERAKELCPKSSDPKGEGGRLARSIKADQIDVGEWSVGTNVNYAVFVHEGTGIYNKDSSRGGAYWVFIKTPGADYDTYKESHPGPGKSYYTLKEAQQAMAILRSKGYDAFYTQGQRPQPFLTNALQETSAYFDKIINDTIKEAL